MSQTGDLWVLGRHRLLCGDSTAQAVDLSPRDADETAWLRHEFRTPLNAIKGYGELLVEEICESGRDTLLTDLGKVLDLADRLLGEIDRVAGTAAASPIDIVGNVLQTIRPLDEADIPDPRAPSSHILVVDATRAESCVPAARIRSKSETKSA